MLDTDAAITILRHAGDINPKRVIHLIQQTISALDLDLSGLTILTEAATGFYATTPILAAAAHADRVIALTRDSQYGSVEAVIEQTRAYEALHGDIRPIEIHTERSDALFSEADVITNLGFVRPINHAAINSMKPSAVIPLMCETWEFRRGDVDLDACHEYGIPVLGTDEDHPSVAVFRYSGWLCLQMLFQAQIEGHKARLALVSADKFGRVLRAQLTGFGLSVQLIENAGQLLQMEAVDAVIVADYSRGDIIIGDGGDISARQFADSQGDAAIIQFAGHIDAAALAEFGIALYPQQTIGPKRMGATLAALGPRGVIELHAAGLKVGQAMAEARLRSGMSAAQSIDYALKHSPAQDFSDGESA